MAHLLVLIVLVARAQVVIRWELHLAVDDLERVLSGMSDIGPHQTVR